MRHLGLKKNPCCLSAYYSASPLSICRIPFISPSFTVHLFLSTDCIYPTLLLNLHSHYYSHIATYFSPSGLFSVLLPSVQTLTCLSAYFMYPTFLPGTKWTSISEPKRLLKDRQRETEKEEKKHSSVKQEHLVILTVLKAAFHCHLRALSLMPSSRAICSD